MTDRESGRTPGVAVVTVAFDSDDALSGLLRSIAASTFEPDIVVVADNAPHVGGAARLSVAWGARYIPMDSNRGYGSAVNRGVSSLPPEVGWILISNPDVILDPGAIEELLTVGRSDDLVAAVGPRITDRNGTLYPSARALPTLRNGIGHALFANIWRGNPWSRAYYGESMDRRRSAGWLSGSCLLVRRAAFEQIGGFDEGYFMYFEDVDLGARLTESGWRLVYEPSARVLHTGAHSTRSRAEQMVAAHHASARRYLSRQYPGLRYFPVRAVLGMGLALRSKAQQRSARSPERKPG